jgi:hypothetical protein
MRSIHNPAAVAGRAQGIVAESPQDLHWLVAHASWANPRTWSGKPGFWREAPKMRPKHKEKDSCAFIRLRGRFG